MKTKLIISICLLTSPFTALAKKKEYPRAEIKVGYTYNETFVRGSDGIIKSSQSFIVRKQSSRIHYSQLHRDVLLRKNFLTML